MLQLGLKGTRLIQSFESCTLVAYKKDDGIWTIGWGHTGPDVTEGQTCTEYQAAKWFTDDTERACRGVLNSITVPVSQNQFDALVSFTYNVGTGNEAHSTLVRLVNSGDVAGAGDQFLVWNHIKGVVSPGLTRRREAERDLFLSVG